MKIKIKSLTDSVLFEGAFSSVKDCLVAAVLQGANLEGANLEGAHLEGANLEGANLINAYLRGANLEGANLEGANLRGAYLRGANLTGANLEGANLEGANLTGAYLIRGAKTIKLIGDRPILTIGPIGSRADYLIAYVTCAGLYLRTGCFFGTAEMFNRKLSETHTGVHASEYISALCLAEKHFAIWNGQ
jgi:uncharacterized protein YjbI with pentapeptide repeats